MKKKIKVLHLISHMNDGGAQRIVLNYLNDLNNDPDIEIKVLVYGDKTNSYCNKIISSNNYNVDYMFEKLHNRYIRKLIKIIFGNMLLKKYFKNYSPDIVHVHISPFITVCLDAIVKCNIPIRFDTLHSNPYRFKGKDLKYIRRAFQKEKFIGICVTNEQVIQAKDYYGLKKYEVVHNGVDVEKIKKLVVSKKEARNSFNISNDKFIIGAVGRLDKIKQFDFLIEVFYELLKKQENSILLIAGDGPERQNLVSLVEKLNIKDKVLFLGNIENVVDLYCAVDVLAITSKSESSSLVLIESQICGVRSVISFGTPDESIITNKVKKMTNNPSKEEWVNALLDKSFCGKKEYDIRDYEVHAMSNKMKEIYIKYWNEHNSCK